MGFTVLAPAPKRSPIERVGPRPQVSRGEFLELHGQVQALKAPADSVDPDVFDDLAEALHRRIEALEAEVGILDSAHAALRADTRLQAKRLQDDQAALSSNFATLARGVHELASPEPELEPDPQPQPEVEPEVRRARRRLFPRGRAHSS